MQQGCDSVHTLNLTINSSSTGTSSATACDSYTWDGVVYTTSGTYSNTYTNAAGCDSVHTLNLTINSSSTGTSSATACDSYTWDGVAYTTSGTYSNTYTNAAGCDSVHTLNLTINNSLSSVDIHVACDSFTWIDGIVYTSSNNTATYMYQTADDCDSLVTLNLTINNSVSTTNNQTVCYGGSYTINGNTYTSSGSYTDVFTAVNGCDSTVTTNLTVLPQFSVVIQSSSSGVCSGSTVTLSMTTYASPTNTYQWNDANGPISGATSSTYNSSIAGTYSLTVTTPAGCSVTSAALPVNIISVTTPTGLFSSNVQLNRGTMNWSSVPNAHHYDVRLRAQGSSTWTTLMLNLVDTSRQKTGLSSSTTYEWQVRSACSNDSSSVSAWSSIQTFTTWTPCSTPVNPTTINISLTSATITWDAVTGTWGYRIRYKKTTDPWSAWVYDTVSTNSYSLTSLSGGTAYQWQVRAMCQQTAPWNNSGFTPHTIFSTGSCASLSLSTSQSNVSCNGGSDGSIDLTVSGGSGSYTYSWDNGSTSEDISSLSAGTYTVIVTDTWGCSETISATITENAAISSSNTQTICNGTSVTVGSNTYTTSGTYTNVLTSASGCDSTVTTVLIVNVATTSTSSVTSCDSYSWNGTTYTSSGVYTYSTTNSLGCDSTATLNLTINNSSTSSSTATACDSYIWNGTTYTTSGLYTYSTTNSLGCDSTATLNLTINNSVSTTNNQTVCYGGSYTINGNTYTSSGSYTDVFTAVNGCDSTITTNLTVLPQFSVVLQSSGSATVCSGSTVPLSMTTYASPANTYQWNDANGPISGATSSTYGATSTGTYSLTVTTPAGCVVTSGGFAVTISAPSVPTGLFSSNVQLNRGTMNWSSVPNAHHYDVRLRAQGSSTWTTLMLNLVDTSRQKTGLSSSTTYEWQVRSACSNDSSSVSAWSSIQTFTTWTPCSTPVNPTTINISLTSATITWDAVTGTWGYRIRYKKTTDPWSAWVYDTVSTNSYSLTSLSGGTAYQWQVRAMCQQTAPFNNSGFTPHTIFSTGSCTSLSLSTSQSNVSCNGGSDGSIDLTVSGGSGSYTYSWDNGSTSEDISSLSAGTYTVIVTDTWGCSETISATITENAAISSSNTQTICNGTSVTVGSNTYTTSGTYTNVLTSASGCDSTVTTVLIVNVATTSTSSVTSCDSYSWNGTTYTSSGVYTYSTTNSLGCDSTATLNLTINNSSTSSITATACDSYIWNGTTYTTSGTYTYSTTNSLGCDSTATLNLTINNSVSTTNNQTVCYGGSYTINGNTYTSSGSYTDVFTAVNGCDSTVTTNLTVLPQFSVVLQSSGSATVCSGSTVPLSMTTYASPANTYQWNDANGPISGATSSTYGATSTGTYSLTVTTPAGCVVTSSGFAVTISAPSVPTGLFSSNVQLNRGTMNWSSVPNAHHYDVRLRAQGSSTWTTLMLNLVDTSRQKTGLSSSTTYEWQVRSACSNDSSSVSAWSSIQTFTTWTPCSTPVNPTTINISLTSATITWDAVTGTWGYRIRYKKTTDPWSAWVYDTVSTNSYSLTSLSGGTAYQWQVRAMCQQTAPFNNSGFTPHTIFSTGSCASLSLSTSQSNVSCNGGSDGSIDLTVSGGSGSYTYSWDNGSTSEDISSLSAGTYTVVVTDTWGCSETISATITENAAISSSNTQTICNGTSVTVGSNTYTTSGTYTNVLTSASGCDSTVTTVLIVNVATTSTSSVTSCDSYSWNGTTYTSSGVYTYSTTNSLGCDSTATLNLTINNSSTSSSTATACDSYIWNGTTYTSSGVYTYSTTNSLGCDSTATLNLTINNSVSTTNNQTVCYGSSYTINGNTYTSSGSYTDVFTAVNGCDSTVTTNLTVLPQFSVVLQSSGSATVCSGSTVPLSMTTYASPANTYQWNDANGPISGATSSTYGATSTGTYSLTVTTPAGCVVTSSGFAVTISAPSVPTGLSSSNVQLNRGTMNWGSVPNAHHYDVRLRAQGSSTWTTLILNISSTSQQKTGLSSSTTYEWQVRSACSNDSSSVSAWSSIQTFTTWTPCSTPVNPTTINISLTSATITWDAVTGTWGYRIRYKKTTDPWSAWVYDTVSTNSYSLTSLSGGTAYQWQVRAMCQQTAPWNNSGFTPNTVFSTGSCASLSLSTSQSNVSCNGGSDGSIDLTVNNGSGSYTYSWDNGSTSEDISSLSAGTYTVIVTDNNWSCIDTSVIVITEPMHLV